uniref:Carboxypeptidase n=1 Tax=Cuerna arida TaxID=1464854 RepID=A0A1B6GYX6_9HEMI
MLLSKTVLLVLCTNFLLIKGHFVKGSAARNSNVGEPLILTPLLDAGNVIEAQRRARVNPDIGNITSYSGYFTVNKDCESNIFFWFFPAQQNQESAPVVLFLQGGPGASSIYSLFEENGPLTYKETLGRRQYSWNVKNNLLFIDQPVGTGYSFTRKGCYAENETVLGAELYSAMVQFYQLFPELGGNKFFISGYSYAGHFIPALGYTIHKNNPGAQVKINLSGMMIGNGWMDAIYQNDLGSYLYQLGLVDTTGRDVYYDYQRRFLEHMRNKEYEKALEIRTAEVSDVYLKYVGNVSILNYLQDNVIFPTPYEQFIQRPDIRRAIHVGNTNFSFESSIVAEKMGVDPVLSVKPWVEELLESYPIVFYTGQLDIICAYPTVENFENNLNWSGEARFMNSARQKWCVNGKQVGYLKGEHNLYDVMIRNAGHAVPFDQAEWAFILINSITSGCANDPFHALDKCVI